MSDLTKELGELAAQMDSLGEKIRLASSEQGAINVRFKMRTAAGIADKAAKLLFEAQVDLAALKVLA